MSVADAAARVAGVAAAHADEVDRDARFPKEAVDALRAEHLLGALVPASHGGGGASIAEVAGAVTVLGEACASTAMVYAMHLIQVHCLVRHDRTPVLDEFLRQVAADELLLASATTEIGIGGDVRTSTCAVEDDGTGRFALRKQAPVISYGEHADAVLATARRTPDSPPNDQVLVVCRRPTLRLEPTSDWDALGFRGTCSLGFLLEASDDLDYVLPVPYADISAQTMLPTSHLLWSSVWRGLAEAAVDRSREFVRAEARKKPGTAPPSAMRLAELMATHQQLVSLVQAAVAQYEEAMADPDALGGMAFAISMNALKVAASELVLDVVSRAMLICGMAGYRNDSKLSLGRLLRDAYGAQVMINNDRINTNNAQLLLVARD